MTTGLHLTPGPGLSADLRAIGVRVASLTDAESQQVLQYLAGLSPGTVDMAISRVKALQGGLR
jgi:hypothetical protein